MAKESAPSLYLPLFVKWMVIFIISSLLIFSVTRFMPVSPMEMMLSARQLPHTRENIDALSREWGLDKPVHIQYLSWIKDFVLGDWGKSYITGRPIREDLLKRIPYSLSIGLGGILLSIPISFALGYMACYRKGIWDLLSRLLSLFNQTVPVFILSLIIIYYFGVKFKLVRFFTDNHGISLVTATLLMSLYTSGVLSRVVKTHFMEVLEESYALRLLSQGFSPAYILLRHGAKPVLYGLNAALIARFASVLGGAAVVEFAFAIPGVSYFLVESMSRRDYNVIQSYMMLIVVWMFVVQLLFRIIQSGLDVRNRPH